MAEEKTRTRSGLQEIQWTTEIPPKPPSRRLYDKQAEQLRQNPGAWALIAQCPSRIAAYGAGYARRKKWGPEYEVAVRDHEVYARFAGEWEGEAASKETKINGHRTTARASKRKAKSK